MPYLHCKNCHHEWESAEKGTKCDWCGGDSYVLEEETPLSKFLKWFDIEKLKEMLKED